MPDLTPASCIRGDHIAMALAPERHRVDRGFRKNDFPVSHQRRFVPHPAQGARQTQVARLRGGKFIIGRNAPPVQLQNLPRMLRHGAVLNADHRHHETAVQMFMPAGPVHAHTLQTGAYMQTVRQSRTVHPGHACSIEVRPLFSGLLLFFFIYQNVSQVIRSTWECPDK